ncbi:5-formyltetrahydrofolate cyclo-ligase, partial [Streptomyces sp. SID8361]|uniref:5-formyltetrahydrofolate cyclo-ligase n=1 Tax=Streptomyces sp. MnatMP-M27 TaxID=1839768 RepID=UPI00144FE6F3
MNTDASKRALRRHHLTVRSRLTADDIEKAGAALACRALELPEIAGAATVAAYVSMGSEPGTHALREALRARGARVLLPVLLEDDDLDWGEDEGAGRLAPARRGLLEPEGPRLG